MIVDGFRIITNKYLTMKIIVTTKRIWYKPKTWTRKPFIKTVPSNRIIMMEYEGIVIVHPDYLYRVEELIILYQAKNKYQVL